MHIELIVSLSIIWGGGGDLPSCVKESRGLSLRYLAKWARRRSPRVVIAPGSAQRGM